MDKPLDRFKPSNGYLVGYTTLTFLAAGLVYDVLAEHSWDGVTIGLGLLLGGLLVWMTQIRPRALALPGVLRLRNTVQDHDIPFLVIDSVTVRHTLNVWVGEERYVCIGIGRSRRERRAELRGDRPSLLGRSRLGEFSEAAKVASLDERAMNYETWVVRRIEELMEAAHRDARLHQDDGPERRGPERRGPERRGPEQRGSEAVRTRWAVRELAVAAVLAVAFVVALLV